MSTSKSLAGVCFEQTFQIDSLLRRAADAFRSRGLHVSGVVQQVPASEGCAGTALRLEALDGAWSMPIMEPRGTQSQGCRLDYRAMADVSGRLAAALQSPSDIFILNRFGRSESEGNGLRDILIRCAEEGRPTLIAVRRDYADAWADFHGGLGVMLQPNLEAILAWYDGLTAASGTQEVVSDARQA